MLLFYFSSFIFKEITSQLKRTTLQKTFDSQDEELNVINDIDDIGKDLGYNFIIILQDLIRIAIIHEECGNLKVFAEGGELSRNINKKKKPGV